MKSSGSAPSAAATGQQERRRLAPRILDASSHSPANFPLFTKAKGIGRLKARVKRRDVLSSIKRPSTTADDESRLSKSAKLEEKLEPTLPRPQTVHSIGSTRSVSERGGEKSRRPGRHRRARPRMRPRTPNGTVQSIRELIGEVEEMKAAEVMRQAAGAFWGAMSTGKASGRNPFLGGATRTSRLPPLNDLQVTMGSGVSFATGGETKEPVFSFHERAKEVSREG